MFEGGDGFAAEAVELADGENDGAFEVIVQIAKGERRAAEATELIAQALGGERLIFGGGERKGGGGLSDVAVGVAGDEGEGRAGVAVKFECDGARETDFLAFEGGAEFAVEGGVVGFPDELAGADAGPIDVAMAEAQEGVAVGRRGFFRTHGRDARATRGQFDLVDAAALFALGGVAGIEDDAVAGLQRGGGAKGDRLTGDAENLAEQDAALGAEAAVGEFLIVDAAEPAGVLAAGERHLEFVVGGGRGRGRAER